MIDQDELNRRFTYHPPQGNQATIYETIRDMGKAFAENIVKMTPESREQSLAITKIEEAVMWSNAALARRS